MFLCFNLKDSNPQISIFLPLFGVFACFPCNILKEERHINTWLHIHTKELMQKSHEPWHAMMCPEFCCLLSCVVSISFFSLGWNHYLFMATSPPSNSISNICAGAFLALLPLKTTTNSINRRRLCACWLVAASKRSIQRMAEPKRILLKKLYCSAIAQFQKSWSQP